ncbi:MAG: VTT domain-containing protein [Bryobacteraceae bacterium]|nr:VTT domain-containing protein [Bryobacteraceae bacterium]MDW8379623.1 VTT domain-containing protein [Bryobacterales bacterium]
MIHALLEFLHTLTNPDKLIHLLSTVLGGPLGYLMLFAVVFAETGLLMGFFLPGDSLLFTVGVVAGAGHLNIITINILLMIAAIVGDGFGYYLGRRTGPAIFSRPNSRFFRQEHLQRTREFYEKHGGKTIIYARFIPIIRTFAPFVAGVGQMSYPRFVSFNVFGGIGWVLSMTMLGYFLGSVPVVQRHFEKVILGIIFISVMPIFIQYARGRN